MTGGHNSRAFHIRPGKKCINKNMLFIITNIAFIFVNIIRYGSVILESTEYEFYLLTGI
jgi:hypothetical protein